MHTNGSENTFRATSARLANSIRSADGAQYWCAVLRARRSPWPSAVRAELSCGPCLYTYQL